MALFALVLDIIVAHSAVRLMNAADPDVLMPAAGLGTGCQIGGCRWNDAVAKSKAWSVAEAMTRRFLSLGGRRIDDADSYGIAQGIGAGLKASPSVARSTVFIVSKVGPGGLVRLFTYSGMSNGVYATPLPRASDDSAGF